MSSDTCALNAHGMPSTSTVLFFHGPTQIVCGAGTAFGDGLRCAGDTVIRLGIRAASAGFATFGAGPGPSISVAGSVPAVGGVR